MTAQTLQFSHMNDADAFVDLLSEPINFSLAGDNVVVSGITKKRILVYRILFVVGADMDITMKNGVSIDLTGPIPMLANGSWVLDISNVPWYQTTEGKDFIIESSDAGQVSGTVYYRIN